jgi:hypothetical protein
MIPTLALGGLGMGRILTPPITSYANAGGTGDRRALFTISSNITWDSGVTSNLFDGDNATIGSTNSVDTPGTGATAIANGSFVRWQSPTKKFIDEFKLYYTTSVANGAWKFQACDDGASWIDLASFTWNTLLQTVAFSNPFPEGFFYHQIVKNGAGTNWDNNWFKEIECKIAEGAS